MTAVGSTQPERTDRVLKAQFRSWQGSGRHLNRDVYASRAAHRRCVFGFKHLAIEPEKQRRPHRIKYLEALYEHASHFDGVLHWNGAEILDWYEASQPSRHERISHLCARRGHSD
jgi:hypothetical protein